MMKTTTAICVLVLNLGLAFSSSQANEQPELMRVTIAERLIRPWDMVFLSATQALVSEKEGGIQRVNLNTGETTPVKGLPTDISLRNKTGLSDNSGLFGLALHPNFAEKPWLYLAYAAQNSVGQSTTKVVRAKFSDNALSNLQTLLVAEPFTEERYHYGGGLLFGADGKLYISVGERLFNEIDQPDLPIAQDVSDPRGKIYRLNDDGSIPSDNPNFGDGAVPGLYALGIRAAQGLALQPATGAIWFSEHGTRQGDELNRLTAGANYGWPIKTTGGYRDPSYQPPPLADRVFTAPVWSWTTTVAPTGLAFYSGDEFPEWQGDLLVAGLSQGNFWHFGIDGENLGQASELFTDSRVRLRNVKQGPDGKLYVLTDEANGRILRIVRAKPN